MSGQGAGSILKDENDPDNSFDIFTFPQKDVCMEKRETQEILNFALHCSVIISESINH